MSSAPAADRVTLLKLAFAEGQRGLDHQSAALDSLHTRVGVLLAGASAATAFFGGAAVDAEATGACLFIDALVAFGLVVAACLCVLWPRDWNFTNDAELIATKYAGVYDEATALEALAKESKKTYDEHADTLRWMFRGFSLAALALALEVALWAWLLATKA